MSGSNERGDTSIEYNTSNANIRLTRKYNEIKIKKYINTQTNNLKKAINDSYSGDSFRYIFQNWNGGGSNDAPNKKSIIFENQVNTSNINTDQKNNKTATILNT